MNRKTCSICKKSRSTLKFGNDPRHRDGYVSACKDCGREKATKYRLANRKKYNENSRKWRQKNKERVWDANLKKLYGISFKDYASLLNKQKGRCLICSSPKNGRYGRLAVDHCHDTSKIRGLLCNNCNSGLGYFNDNIYLLQQAIKYLKEDLT